MCSVVTAPEYCSSCSLQGRSLFQQHSLEQDFKLTITKGTITPGQLNHIARFSQHLSNKDNASLSVEYKTTYRQAQSIQVSKFVFKNSSSFVLSFFFFLFSFFLFIIFFSFFFLSFSFFLLPHTLLTHAELLVKPSFVSRKLADSSLRPRGSLNCE